MPEVEDYIINNKQFMNNVNYYKRASNNAKQYKYMLQQFLKHGLTTCLDNVFKHMF